MKQEPRPSGAHQPTGLLLEERYCQPRQRCQANRPPGLLQPAVKAHASTYRANHILLR